MAQLGVPYIRQFVDGACGAAVLEMVCRFYGATDIDQKEIFNRLQELEPHNTGNFRISTDELVKQANAKGFPADWFRVKWLDQNAVLAVIDEHCAINVPLIACQRYEPPQPQLGHFRVITGRNKK